MELDEFGFPKPRDFKDERENGRKRTGVRLSSGRIVLLLLGLCVAGGGAALVHFGPDLARGFGDLARGMLRDQLQADELKLRRMVGEGNFAGAVTVCDRMLRLQPRNSQLHLLKVQLLFQSDQKELAIKACDKWRRAMPHSSEPQHIKASLLAEMKDYPAAIKECDRILRTSPKDSMALNNRAYFRALARVDLQLAFEDVEKALEAEPKNYSYIDTRGYLHFLLGRFDKALADYNVILSDQNYIDARPNEVGEIFFHRGLLYKHMKRAVESERDYKEAERRGYKIDQEPKPVISPERLNNA